MVPQPRNITPLGPSKLGPSRAQISRLAGWLVKSLLSYAGLLQTSDRETDAERGLVHDELGKLLCESGVEGLCKGNLLQTSGREMEG